MSENFWIAIVAGLVGSLPATILSVLVLKWDKKKWKREKKIELLMLKRNEERSSWGATSLLDLRKDDIDNEIEKHINLE